MDLFRPNATTLAMTATNTAARLPRQVVADGNGLDSVRVYNHGNDVVFVAFGGDTVTAVVPAPNSTGVGVPVPPRAVEAFLVPETSNYISVVAPSAGPHVLYFTSGQGI
jgi:hypothetical protein